MRGANTNPAEAPSRSITFYSVAGHGPEDVAERCSPTPKLGSPRPAPCRFPARLLSNVDMAWTRAGAIPLVLPS